MTNSPVWQFSARRRLPAAPAGYQGPDVVLRLHLGRSPKERAHGERFAYKTVNTDTLAWVLRRVTGRSASELLRERFWSKLGVEQDAYFTVDCDRRRVRRRRASI